MLKFLGKVPFWLKTLVGFAAGIGVGLYWGEAALPVVDPIGDTFIRAIKMLVAPLVFLTVSSAVARLGNSEADGVGGKAVGLGLHTIALFMLTSAFAVSIGLGLGTWFEPGQGMAGLIPETVKPNHPATDRRPDRHSAVEYFSGLCRRQGFEHRAFCHFSRRCGCGAGGQGA